MDIPIGEVENCTIMDILSSDFNMEKELSEIFAAESNEKVKAYFSDLSDMSRNIVLMKMEGYESGEIQSRLHITREQYNKYMNYLRSYEKRKILIRDTDCSTESGEGIEMEENYIEERTSNITSTSEKTKDTSLAISAISKKLRKHQIRDDHVLQRSSGQWTNLYKSELVSDILQGKSLTPIIISEEIKDGITMHWLIDGKQRCTNIEEYLSNGFAISKNVQRYHIQYQTEKKDNKGNIILNEDGFPIPEKKVFDIRKKKFSQLPEELQDRFLDYQVPVMLNLNCTKIEIAYDIARFNRCRPMNVAQNGWTGLTEEFAEYVDNILKMKFFKEDSAVSSYRESNNTSGMMRRMIVESIMVTYFYENFSKDFRKICDFLSENANDTIFIEFYSMVERLSAVAKESVSHLFNTRDSFLWFGLFARFIKTGLNDGKFIEFMEEFSTNLYYKEVNGESYEFLDSKSTKDRFIVIHKLNHLEKLMREYLHINIEETVTELLEFIQEQVNEDATQEDLVCYEDTLHDLIQRVDHGSKLLERQNHVSLLAMVAYSYVSDIDLDDWFVDYFNHNQDYILNQKANFITMKNSMEQYYRLAEKKAV